MLRSRAIVVCQDEGVLLLFLNVMVEIHCIAHCVMGAFYLRAIPK